MEQLSLQTQERTSQGTSESKRYGYSQVTTVIYNTVIHYHIGPVLNTIDIFLDLKPVIYVTENLSKHYDNMFFQQKFSFKTRGIIRSPKSTFNTVLLLQSTSSRTFSRFHDHVSIQYVKRFGSFRR